MWWIDLFWSRRSSQIDVGKQWRLNQVFENRYPFTSNSFPNSMSYTGTGALKSALTRNGKMTITGLVSDSLKSLQRTYQNYYLDNEKQEIIDFFLGNKSEQVEDEQVRLFFYFFQPKRSAADFLDRRIGWQFNLKLDKLNSWTKITWLCSLELTMSEEIRQVLPPGNISFSNWLLTLFFFYQAKVWTVGLAIWIHPHQFQTYMWSDFKRLLGSQESLSGMQTSLILRSHTMLLFSLLNFEKKVWQKMILDYISQHNKYVLLRYYQLVGVVLSVFVRQVSNECKSSSPFFLMIMLPS